MVTLATLQLSEVDGVPRFTPVAVQPVFVITALFGGQVIVGFTLSVTVTVWLHVAVLPDPSVTVHVTTVVPNG